MHQVGLVEAVLVEGAVLRVLHHDLRGLRDAGQQLVGGVRGEHQRAGARPARADRMHVAVELVEFRVRQPGLVEVQRVEQVAQQVLDVLDVVDHAVVGALGDRQDPRLGVRVLLQRLAGERVRLDLLADVLRLELVARDRPDDAEVVARRRQEHGNRMRHGDRVQDRLVAVAVDQHDVARRHVGVPDDLVRGRGAVGDEEQVVGAEDARGVALRGGHRAGMVEQLAEFVDGIADVGAQHVLAEELVEHLAERVLQEGHPARVPRAVPRIGALVGVLDQLLEERRRQRIEVDLGLADDVARHELRRVLEHVDEAVQLAQHVVRDMARGTRLAVQEDRDVSVAAAHFGHEGAQFQDGGGQFGQFAVRAGFPEHQLVIVDRQDEARRAARLLRERGQIAVARQAEDFHPFLLDRFGKCPDAGARDVLGAEIFVDDDDGKTKLHGRISKKNDRGARSTAVTRSLVGVAGKQPDQVFGSVTPRWPWYLPPRSA